ncbi:MAG: trigger factor [Bacteroidota bacterium]|nr:trigger factor [Bacteroidota bacterium]
MEVSITDISDIEKEIQIQTTAEELVPLIEEAYKRNQQKIEIKGFRKGKAPLDLIRRIYGESIEYSELDAIASDVYRQIIKERGIQPIGEPVLTDIDYKRGESLFFKVKYEIKPIIELREYKGIAVEKIIHKITDQEIEDEILHIRKSNSTMQEAETAIDDEHIVTADLQQLDESGIPLIGRRNNDARIYLSSETIYPEIKEALQNVKIGETRKVRIKRDNEEHQHNENLEITAKKIERVILPDFTDDFINKITKEKTKTVSEFQTQLKSDIEEFWSDKTERRFIDTLINEIVQRHDFNVPDTLVKSILDSFVEDIKNRNPNKKLPQDFEEDKFRENNRTYAIFQAKWFLIRERIIEAEKISVEEIDLERLAETEASKVGIEKDRLYQFYKSSNSVKEKIITDKLLRFLKEHAVISEKVTEDFF